jgi:hypothetical protein
MEKLLKKLLYGEDVKPMQNKSKSNTILARYERVQRLRNIAIDDNTFCKVYQANRLLKELTIKLNQINSYQILNLN